MVSARVVRIIGGVVYLLVVMQVLVGTCLCVGGLYDAIGGEKASLIKLNI